MRYQKLPKLGTLLKRYDRSERQPQQPAEVWATLKAIAAQSGIRVTRHSKPLPRPVFH